MHYTQKELVIAYVAQIYLVYAQRGTQHNLTQDTLVETKPICSIQLRYHNFPHLNLISRTMLCYSALSHMVLLGWCYNSVYHDRHTISQQIVLQN